MLLNTIIESFSNDAYNYGFFFSFLFALRMQNILGAPVAQVSSNASSHNALYQYMSMESFGPFQLPSSRHVSLFSEISSSAYYTQDNCDSHNIVPDTYLSKHSCDGHYASRHVLTNRLKSERKFHCKYSSNDQC